MNPQMFPMSHEGGLNNQPPNNFQPDQYNKFAGDNPFFNQGDCFGYPQNIQNPNNFLLQQPQPQQIYANGINGIQQKPNSKGDEKSAPVFNAQTLAYSENFNPRSYIKNTYINKINNLMSNSLNEFKANEEKK
jgi:hypothetical protein